MINPKDLYDELIKSDISFFTGVPDSLLKDICGYITDNTNPEKNVIAANEGSAVSLAAGCYMATGKPGVVYMQNSGEGNAVNPLASLTDPDVYSIPLLLMIGWRGEPGKKDEPQHVKQGKITTGLLETMGIPYIVLPDSTDAMQESIKTAVETMKKNSAPYAIIIKKGTFEPYSLKNKLITNYELNREGAVKLIIDNLDEKDIVVSTTGKTSREVFEYREERGDGHSRDFLTVGAMGHASQIALGIALSRPDRRVVCLDGDGAAIMHLGALAITGTSSCSNMKHIIINNGAHDSVGGQPTVGFNINFAGIATACGYKTVMQAETSKQINEKIGDFLKSEGPSLLEIRVNKGARDDLGRPTTTPIQNKESFMEFLSE